MLMNPQAYQTPAKAPIEDTRQDIGALLRENMESDESVNHERIFIHTAAEPPSNDTEVCYFYLFAVNIPFYELRHLCTFFHYL